MVITSHAQNRWLRTFLDPRRTVNVSVPAFALARRHTFAKVMPVPTLIATVQTTQSTSMSLQFLTTLVPSDCTASRFHHFHLPDSQTPARATFL
jgi:hypothetical protein